MMLNRVSLNTIGLNRIGLNRIGKPSRASSDRPYIDPEVLASLKAVCICYGKSNDDPDRAVVKNLVDPDNPFVISNAAYKLNSGFGKYEEDFDSWIPNYNVATLTYTPSKLHITSVVNGNGISYTRKATNAMKVEVTGMQSLDLIYRYITGDDTWGTFRFDGDGIYELPASGTTTKTYYTGFSVLNYKGDCDITIEQIPSFEGAFVTDGVDDSITSTKTVQEMLGGSNEITVVSMIHLIDINHASGAGFTNYVRVGSSFIRSQSKVNDKTGIYGWTYSNSGNIGTINNILGDKNDYETTGSSLPLDSVFNVEGFSHSSGISEICQVAWYWTFIANRVLTSDEINQVIAYYNLDRTLKPNILCNTIKQGITNENHAEFGDKLIDFSGNGRDIQLNNIAWKGDSGIGKYEMDFLDFNYGQGLIIESRSYNKFIAKTDTTTNPNILLPIIIKTSYKDVFWESTIIDVELKGGCYLTYFYINEEDALERARFDIKSSGRYTLPKSYGTSNASVGIGFYVGGLVGIVKVTQIPSHAGALCLDGVNDFGKVTGMPVYKDYTIVADYERLKIDIGVDSDSPILSKSELVNSGAFMFNTISSSGDKVSYSFGRINIINADDTIRKIFYQSKYINDGQDINIESTFVDSDKLWLGTYRDSDYRFIEAAIYSLMSFPYSMSEFLIERQLKRYKLGTLYPDMVEFRPIVKSNLPYSSITYSVNPGEYISVDSMVTITVTFPNTSDKLMEVSCNAISDISISGDNGVYEITGKIVKSPQKINLVISSYLTMLNNETLISNETLIKNE